MRRAIPGVTAMLLATFSTSAAERTLTSPEILKDLKGMTVEGKGWSQAFFDGGGTTYTAGDNSSNGRWDVRGDKYCSVWPPSDVWACYAMTVDENGGRTTVIWIADDGSRTSGTLLAKGK